MVGVNLDLILKLTILTVSLCPDPKRKRKKNVNKTFQLGCALQHWALWVTFIS